MEDVVCPVCCCCDVPADVAAGPSGLVLADAVPKRLLSFDEGESDSLPGILRLAFTFGLSIGGKFARFAFL